MASIYRNGILDTKVNNAGFQDVNAIIQAGIDPKTGLPIKLGSSPCALKDSIKRQLRVVDEQDAINRYT